MWLDVERFVHPYCEGTGGYEKEPRFQAFAFILRFGWWLLIALGLVLVVQLSLLREADHASPE
jgi:hypothetical protein